MVARSLKLSDFWVTFKARLRKRAALVVKSSNLLKSNYLYYLSGDSFSYGKIIKITNTQYVRHMLALSNTTRLATTIAPPAALHKMVGTHVLLAHKLRS